MGVKKINAILIAIWQIKSKSKWVIVDCYLSIVDVDQHRMEAYIFFLLVREPIC